MSGNRQISRVVIGVFMIIATSYLGSYLVLSRLAYRRADELNLEGFYFVIPMDEKTKRANALAVWFFRPLILIDTSIGTGRYAASDPMERLE